jgi:hypothetical protein
MKPTNTLLRFYRWYVSRRALVWLFFGLFMSGAVIPHSLDRLEFGESPTEVIATALFLVFGGVALFYSFFKFAIRRNLRSMGYTDLRLQGGDE